MAASRAVVRRLPAFSSQASFVRMMCSPGEGSGRGGGSGGSIRDAGGAFGKMEQVHEEQYFRQLQSQQLHAMKEQQEHMVKTLKSEIDHHKEAAKRGQERLEKLQKGMAKKDGNDTD